MGGSRHRRVSSAWSVLSSSLFGGQVLTLHKDYITVNEVDFGESFPVCSNAVFRPADETGRIVGLSHRIWA